MIPGAVRQRFLEIHISSSSSLLPVALIELWPLSLDVSTSNGRFIHVFQWFRLINSPRDLAHSEFAPV